MSRRREHGTYAGWNDHTRSGEKPCPECRRAATEYVAMHRFRTGKQKNPRRCNACGSVFPDHRCGGIA